MKTGFVVAIVVVLMLALAGVAYAATLTPQVITTDGLVVTPVAGSGTGAYEFPNTGREFIYIENGSGGELDYTVTIPGKVGGYELEDITGAVATGTTVYVGPFNPTYANNASGNVGFTVSVTSSVNLAVLRLP